MSILSAGRKGTFSQALYARLGFCDVTNAASNAFKQLLRETEVLQPSGDVVIFSKRLFPTRWTPPSLS
jgi:hypothetical protein